MDILDTSTVKDKTNVNSVVSQVLSKYKKGGEAAESKTENKSSTSSERTNKINLDQLSADQKSSAGLEEQVDVTEESKLADQIRNQAKAIADEQSKQQQKDKAAGTLKISSAAAALNNAEMGIESAAEETEASKSEVVSISSDQLYIGDKNNASKKEDEPVAAQYTAPESSTEAAAITMAKQAAKNAVLGKKDKKDDSSSIKKSTNLELESSADLENA